MEKIIGPAIRLAEENEEDFFKLVFANFQQLSLALEQKEDPAKAYEICRLFSRFFKTMRHYWLFLIAEANQKQGEVEKGMEILAEAFDVRERSGEGYAESELHRLKGAFFAMQDAPEEEIESHYLQAVEIAGSQASPWYGLLAAKSLARFWQGQNRTEEAYDLLHGAYSRFSEGLDLAEMQEAERLLKYWRRTGNLRK